MEQNPSWNADTRSASQESPRLLWKVKVHYRVHKNPSLDLNWNQINTVHTIIPRITSILILSSHLCLGLPSGSSLQASWLHFCRHFSHFSCVLHALINLTLFEHHNNVWQGVLIMKLLIMQFSLLSSYSPSLLGPNICSHFHSNHMSLPRTLQT